MNKRKSNYIYIEMRHKMLIVGVIIIHVCRTNREVTYKTINMVKKSSTSTQN